MTRNFDEAQQEWAYSQFKGAVMDVRETDTFDINTATWWEGGCETCSYQTTGIEIMNYRTGATIREEMSFSEVLRAINEFAEETE